jgi:DNA-binding CsgD family transcriptional regulator
MAAESRCAIALACLGDLAAGEERASGARAYFASMRDVATVLDGSATERDPYEFGLSWVASGIAAIARGEFDAIYSSLRGAIQECGNPPNARVVRTLAPMMLQVLHCLDRSDGADMDMWLDMLAPRGEGRQPAFRQLFNALHAHTHGRPNPDAEGLPPRPTRFPDLQSLSVATLAAETAVSLRDADGAREHRSTFEYLNERGMTFTVGWVALVPRLLGAMYALGGEELRAQTTLEQALRIARSTGARMEMALTRLELAELHAARGAVTAAEADLLDARSLFAAIHMRSSDRRVRELTAKLGFRQPPVADGLLDDEVAILRLVAAGLNNRAIAEQRNTTIAALQRQLAALYAKIGAENRLAAIAYAYRTGIAREGE